MKKIITLVLLFFLITVHAQPEQIDSIKLVNITADNLVFVVHSTVNGGADYSVIEYIEDEDVIKVNILYVQTAQEDCFCELRDTIRIKKDTYTKAIVEVRLRNLHDYIRLVGIQKIDLLNIVSIHNPTISNKISVFPNPVQNVFHVNLGENKRANLEIYDIQGRLLLSEVIIYRKGIDVSSLSSGLYFIVVDKESVYKIIKE